MDTDNWSKCPYKFCFIALQHIDVSSFATQICKRYRGRHTVISVHYKNVADFCVTIFVALINREFIFLQTCHMTTSFDCNYGNYGNYGYDGGMGTEETYCRRSQSTQCYDTPRVVTSEVCYPKNQQLCQKLVNKYPVPKQKPVCHNEEKKECELEEKSQPKQVMKCLASVEVSI